MVDQLGWYSVRSVFRWARAKGTPYEERMTLWRACSLDDALARSEVEAERYAAEAGVTYLGFAQAFFMGDVAVPGDGTEVFSLLRDSSLDPDDYLSAFFDTGGEHAHQVS
jgi:hypothetical protein